MFEWIKEKKLQSLLDRARIFLAQNYEEPYEPEEPEKSEQQSSGAKHSDRDTGSQGPKVQYQRLEPDKPKFSSRDNNDSDAVQLMTRNILYSTPTSRMIRDLNANTNMTFVAV